MSQIGNVRSNGDSTILDVEIGGRHRLISVSREAIEDYLHLLPEAAARWEAEDRRAFVEKHLSLVVSAADRKLAVAYFDSELIMIETGEL